MRIPYLYISVLVIGTPAVAQEFRVHEFETMELTTDYHGEGANAADFNQDGVSDIVSGAYWYEGPEYTARHAIYPPKKLRTRDYSDNFFAFPHDFDGDGWIDVLFVGFPGNPGAWYRNPAGAEGHWQRHQILDVVDNESPTLTDVDGDGRPELVCMTGDRMGYAAVDWEHPERPWAFHAISDIAAGPNFTHGLGVGDVNGDGRADILWKNGWFEQPADGAAAGDWPHHAVVFASKRGSAQMFAYDVDGDGDNDVISCHAAHGFGLNWYENRPSEDGIAFTKHQIMGETAADNAYGVVFSNIHAMDFVDMDGDGLKDIIAGNRYWVPVRPNPDKKPTKNRGTPCLYWFQLCRDEATSTVEFVPHAVEHSVGVGTQVVATDVSGDGLPDLIVGNKCGTFVYRHTAKSVSEAQWREVMPKKIADH